MTKTITLDNLFAANKFVPVVIINNINKAVSLAKALLNGGISVVEITLRTPNALKIIETIVSNVPDMMVGAGTVLTQDQYDQAVKHGAQFIVSPGLTSNLIVTSAKYDVPFLPGAITPTEIMNAVRHGFNYLKFFPAESYNGLNILKSLESPFPQVKFCPTGGINLLNAKQYLNLTNVSAVGCTFLANQELLATNDYATITKIAKEALQVIRK